MYKPTYTLSDNECRSILDLFLDYGADIPEEFYDSDSNLHGGVDLVSARAYSPNVRYTILIEGDAPDFIDYYWCEIRVNERTICVRVANQDDDIYDDFCIDKEDYYYGYGEFGLDLLEFLIDLLPQDAQNAINRNYRIYNKIREDVSNDPLYNVDRPEDDGFDSTVDVSSSTDINRKSGGNVDICVNPFHNQEVAPDGYEIYLLIDSPYDDYSELFVDDAEPELTDTEKERGICISVQYDRNGEIVEMFYHKNDDGNGWCIGSTNECLVDMYVNPYMNEIDNICKDFISRYENDILDYNYEIEELDSIF